VAEGDHLLRYQAELILLGLTVAKMGLCEGRHSGGGRRYLSCKVTSSARSAMTTGCSSIRPP
jgi:hypothetical protein